MRGMATGILIGILLSALAFGAFLAYDRQSGESQAASLEERGDMLVSMLGDGPSMAELRAGLAGICASLNADEHAQSDACMAEPARNSASLA